MSFLTLLGTKHQVPMVGAKRGLVLLELACRHTHSLLLRDLKIPSPQPPVKPLEINRNDMK